MTAPRMPDVHVGNNLLEFRHASNRGSWIVSFADLMTILLTFMVLILSMAVIPQTKFDMLVQAITGEKIGNLQEVKTKIDEVLEREQLGGEVSTTIDELGLTLEFSSALLFASGDADLTDRANEALTPIAVHLVNDLEPVYGLIIEGYTDDVPISNGRFRSNWELSTSRAINVMERLAAAGIDRRRMSVQGFADTRAATDVDLHDADAMATMPDTARTEARAANRRVVIRIDRLHTDVIERNLKHLVPAAEEATP